jgi:two-component system cell cycle sensor histidine kinase/response regulator CckA
MEAKNETIKSMSKEKLLRMSIGLAALAWILDSLLDSLIFHEGTLIEQIIAPNDHEIGIRILFGSILIVFGIHTRFAITRIKQAEEALKAAIIKAEDEKNKTKAIIEAIGDGIILQDTDYKIVYQNQIQNELYGNCIGEYCYKAYEGKDSICEDCPIERSLRDGKIHRAQKSVATGNEISYFELTGSPLRDSAGKIIGGVKVVRNITDLKRIEEDLHTVQDRLELRVRERTAELEKANKALKAEITERKLAEKALRESEERYHRLVEFSPEGIIVHNLHELIFVNTAAAKILGSAKPEELIGKTIKQIIHPDYWEIVNERLHMEKDGKQAPLIEEKMLKIDGSPVDVEVVAIPYTFEGKSEVHSVVRDISERKRAEIALRESEERFKNIYVQSPIGIEVYDSEGNLIDANKACLDIFGVSDVKEVKGFRLFEDPNITEGIKEKLHSGGITRYDALFDFEKVKKHKLYKTTRSGIIYLDVLITPIGEKEKVVSGYLVQIQDITLRKQTEEKTREQAALLDRARDAIYVRDLEHRIIYYNKSAECLYGWKAEEIMGKNADELLYKKIPATLMDAKKSVIEKGEWSGEQYQVTRDGRQIIIESRWTLMRDSEEKPKSILVINTDITEKKKLEEQFLRAQRMESIGTLASGIAHDINNVLAPIMLSMELLKEKCTDVESMKLVDIIERSAKRGASLMKQVQSFARGMEGERMHLHGGHLISEIRQIARETFPKSIEIRIQLPKDLWIISGDATQLHQVLMNLCVNARDAMPDGGVLRISAENLFIDENFVRINIEARVGPYIVITVSDTGNGISPEIMDKIFEPFFTTKGPGKGTGLGLSTSLGIVKSHGGFINVYSETGKGTSFKVYLPAIPTIETQKAVDKLHKLSPGHGESILVVDDEVQIREITKATLEKYGYRVIIANNGAEALALYNQNINVILMDMVMPVMDGPTSIRELRKVNAETKIIGVSGLTDKDKLEKIAETHVDAFLTKPYTTEKLLMTIREVISAK